MPKGKKFAHLRGPSGSRGMVSARRRQSLGITAVDFQVDAAAWAQLTATQVTGDSSGGWGHVGLTGDWGHVGPPTGAWGTTDWDGLWGSGGVWETEAPMQGPTAAPNEGSAREPTPLIFMCAVLRPHQFMCCTLSFLRVASPFFALSTPNTQLFHLGRRVLRSGREFSAFDLAVGAPLEPAEFFDVEDCLALHCDALTLLDEPGELVEPSPIASDLNSAPTSTPTAPAISTHSATTRRAALKEGSKHRRREKREA
ncbi:hypothetical protein B0H14DRAFT_3505325 [Mycena olivaceomarginata]|nr:hypothetical protein B0H14DRAFT_3505325 [Mycena olivaceomarginata]